jgi:Flp pilus assembly protein TadB
MIDIGNLNDPVWRLALVGLVFAALLGLCLVVLLPAMAGGDKRRRLAEVQQYRIAEDTEETSALPGGAITRTALSVTEQVVRARGWEGHFAAQLDRAGMKLRPHEWVLLRVVVLVGTAGLLTLVLGLIALPFGLVFGWLATATYHRSRARRRADRFAVALPEALQLVIGSLRSGFSLQQALEGMVREADDQLEAEFGRALAEIRLGMELEDALDRLARRTHNQDLAWTVMAIRVQREVGGNLAEVLNTTVNTIRERELLRGHVRALSAEGRLSAWILVALPIVMGGFMFVFRPEYISPLVTDPRGVLMLLVGISLLCVGAFWLSRAVRVEV